MFYFHNNLKSHKVFNASLQPKYFTLPKQSGVLATEEDVTTNTLVSMIKKPSITFPENDSIDYINVINYTPYTKNPLYLGSKTHTSFEVAFDIGFTNIFRSEKIEDADEFNTTMPLPLDVSKTALYIRIKFHSGLYSSPWSDPIKVTVREFKINVPTIITPTNNASGINKNIVISTSAFSYVGVADTHASTTYQISSDINFNNIVFNSTSITELTSIIATMEEGKTYFLRVRHNGTKYGSSNWSTTAKVSTSKVSTSVPITPLIDNMGITGSINPKYKGSYSMTVSILDNGSINVISYSRQHTNLYRRGPAFTNPENIKLYAKFTKISKVPRGSGNEFIGSGPSEGAVMSLASARFTVVVEGGYGNYSGYNSDIELLDENLVPLGIKFKFSVYIGKGY